MPRVDISEAVVEVLGWCPKFMEAFTSIAGTGAHLDELDISVAACLTAQALNITYGPIAVKGVPALERHRLGYVDHTYLRADNYDAANPPDRQAGRDRLRPGPGRRPGRRDRRHALHRPGALRLRPAE